MESIYFQTNVIIITVFFKIHEERWYKPAAVYESMGAVQQIASFQAAIYHIAIFLRHNLVSMVTKTPSNSLSLYQVCTPCILCLFYSLT